MRRLTCGGFDSPLFPCWFCHAAGVATADRPLVAVCTFLTVLPSVLCFCCGACTIMLIVVMCVKRFSQEVFCCLDPTRVAWVCPCVVTVWECPAQRPLATLLPTTSTWRVWVGIGTAYLVP